MRARKLFEATDDLTNSRRYIAALIILQQLAPVHYTVLITTEVVWTRALPTAGTDGVYVYVNPDFFRGLATDGQRAFLLAHEAAHIILRHPLRGKMYRERGCFVGGLRWDDRLFNIAADYIINADCIAMGLEPIPDGCYSEQYDEHCLTDEVYAELLGQQPEPPQPPEGEGEGEDEGEDGDREEGDPAPRDDESDDGDDDSESGGGSGDDEGDDDSGSDGEGDSDSDDEGEGEGSGGDDADDKSDGESGEGGSGGSGDLDDPVGHDYHLEPQYDGTPDEQAADQAEDQYELGNAIDEGIDEAESRGLSVNGNTVSGGTRAQAGNAEVDWRTELQDELRRVGAGGKVTWSQIKRRRFATLGVVSPERRGLMQRMAVIVDISGSVCRDALNRYLVELASAIDELQPSDGCVVLFTNTEVESVHEVFSGGELLDLDIPMGGGTWMTAGVEYLEENGLDCDIVMCFTDCMLSCMDWVALGANDVLVISDRTPYASHRRSADEHDVRIIVAAA